MSYQAPSQERAERLQHAYQETHDSISSMRREIAENKRKELIANQRVNRPLSAEPSRRDFTGVSSVSLDDRARIENVKRLLAERRQGMSTSQQSITPSHAYPQSQSPQRSRSPSSRNDYFSEDTSSSASTSLVTVRPVSPASLSSVPVPTPVTISAPHRSPSPAPMGTNTPKMVTTVAEPRWMHDSVYARLHASGMRTKLKADKVRRTEVEISETSYEPEITRTAKSLKRSGSVEDILLKRNAEYKAHIEELRREREKSEMAQLKAPEITPTSKSLQTSVPAHERLYNSGREYAARKELARARAEEKALADVTLEPEINPTSARIARGSNGMYSHCMEWEERRRQKVEHLRSQREDEEERELAKSWKMNPVSRRLAAMQDRRGRVEDRLLMEKAIREQRLEQLKRQKEEQAALLATPVISSHSANLSRPGDVVERLYRSSMMSNSSRNSSVDDSSVYGMQSGDLTNRSSRSMSAEPRRPNSAGPEFRPQINPRSAALTRKEPIEEVLLRAGAETELKRLRRTIDEEQHRKHESGSSKMGPFSKLLATLVEERTHVPAKERMKMPIGNLKERTKKEMESESSKFTFKPAIPESSRELDRKNNGPTGGVLSRRELLMQKQALSEHKRRMLAEKVTQQELKECTFSPRVETSPRRSAEYSVRQTSTSGRENGEKENRPDFMQRNIDWLKSIEERLARQRAAKEDQELEECTFRPNSSPPKRQHSPTPEATRSRRSGSNSSQQQQQQQQQQSGYASPRQSNNRNSNNESQVNSSRNTEPSAYEEPDAGDDAELQEAIRLLSTGERPQEQSRQQQQQPQQRSSNANQSAGARKQSSQPSQQQRTQQQQSSSSSQRSARPSSSASNSSRSKQASSNSSSSQGNNRNNRRPSREPLEKAESEQSLEVAEGRRQQYDSETGHRGGDDDMDTDEWLRQVLGLDVATHMQHTAQ